MPVFFSIDHIAFTVFAYAVSYIELVGTIAGLLCVALAARNNVLTWPTAILNVSCFFLIFWQVRLYADMFLQVYFMVMNIYGWVYWTQREQAIEHPLRWLPARSRLLSGLVILIFTLVMGWVIAHLHLWAGTVFPEPAAFPYIDSLIAVMSILAQLWLARRIIESWVLWVLVDAIAMVVYFWKGIMFIALEYLIFFFIASYGLYHWRKLWLRQGGSKLPVTHP